MAKSKNHTAHNRSYEAHRNDIKKRRKHRHTSTKGRGLHFSTVRYESREPPAVDLSILRKILKVLVDSRDKLRVTKLILHDKNFFRKLMDWFRVCEDLENKEGLHMMYKIVKGIILLNSCQIFEKVFGDELVMDIFGCLEYDMETPHVNHRNFLKEHVVFKKVSNVVFKEAIPIKDPLTLSKIHHTYIIGYLKDVVLRRVLDKATFASLKSMFRSNSQMVVTSLTDDSTFIMELFARLKSPTTSSDSKRNLVYFLHEFCCLIMCLEPKDKRVYFFRYLVAEDLYGVVTEILQSEDKKLVLTGAHILLFSVLQDPTLLRTYVSLKHGVTLLGLLVKGMLTDFEEMHCQFLEILKCLLYSFATAEQRDAILEVFYERHLDQLISVITSSCKIINENHGFQASAKPEILLNICDLLYLCVLRHPFRIRCNFLLNGALDKVLYLTRRREKYLVVAAVRFIRALISLDDEHLASYIAKNNILRPIIDAFIGNGNRNNFLNSVVLELFEHICEENLKILLKYIVETFWGQLVKFDSLPFIQSLKVRYDQNQKEEDSRRPVEERVLEKEEGYFNKDNDEEDLASAATPRTTQTHAKPGLLSESDAGSSSLSDEEDSASVATPRTTQTHTKAGLSSGSDACSSSLSDEEDLAFAATPRTTQTCAKPGLSTGSNACSSSLSDEEDSASTSSRTTQTRAKPGLSSGSDASSSSLRVGGLVNNKDGNYEGYKPPPKKQPDPNLVKKPLALVDVSNTLRTRNGKNQPLRVGGHEEYKPPPEKQSHLNLVKPPPEKLLSLVDVIQYQPRCCSNRKEKREKSQPASMTWTSKVLIRNFL